MKSPVGSGVGATASPNALTLPKRYYSERELAAYAGLSARTLQGWRLRGQGPPWRKWAGGAIRYSIEQFDQWVAAQPGGGEPVE